MSAFISNRYSADVFRVPTMLAPAKGSRGRFYSGDKILQNDYPLNHLSFLLTAEQDAKFSNSPFLKDKANESNRALTKWENLEVGDLVLTKIEEVSVTGFTVWGEIRLCLPQLLRFVLNDFDVDTIVNICTELQLICDKCNPAQLKILHSSGILPQDVACCGLIRKSDAERLCKVLLHQDAADDIDDKSAEEPRGRQCYDDIIEVMHSCFGKQKGYLVPELYIVPGAKCIECDECHRFFAPEVFVGHTHCKEEVSGITHWGFDSSNWRKYLRLFVPKGATISKEDTDDLQKRLDTIKAKYIKREKKQTEAWNRSRGDGWTPKDICTTLPPPPKLFTSCLPGPVPSNLQSGSPVLVNPESVVRHAEAENYDRDYAPNVCLVPVKRPVPNKDLDLSGSVDKRLGHRDGHSAFSPPTADGKRKVGTGGESVNGLGPLNDLGLQVMSTILHGNLHSGPERSRLLEQLDQFQQAYKLQLEQLSGDNRRLAQLLCSDRTSHEATVTRLESELKELRCCQEEDGKKAAAQIKDLLEEKDLLNRQIREAACPDVHKTRIKYTVAKAELETVTEECEEWRRKFEEAQAELTKLRLQLEEMATGEPARKKARQEVEETEEVLENEEDSITSESRDEKIKKEEEEVVDESSP